MGINSWIIGAKATEISEQILIEYVPGRKIHTPFTNCLQK